MKNVTINLYSFNELSEEVQKKVVDHFRDSVGDYGHWWESTYDDAENIGLKIESHDMDSASFIRDVSGNFTLSAHEVAANIIGQHGEDCDTFKTAQGFLEEVNDIQGKYSELEGKSYEDEMMEAGDKFLNDLLIDYKNMLQKEFEYLSSEEVAKETIEANSYFFFQDGQVASCTTYTGKHEKAGVTEFHFHGQDFILEETYDKYDEKESAQLI